MKSMIFTFLSLFFLMISCNTPLSNEKIVITEKQQWAHRVNDTIDAQEKQHLFKGVELDLIYSNFQQQLFVGHDLEDTLEGLTFEKWLSTLEQPQQLQYWLDMKYLNEENATRTVELLKNICQDYDIQDNIIVESYNSSALRILKSRKIPVLFWVDDLRYWEEKDTAKWINHVTKKLEELQPDAISGSVANFPLLSQSFPNFTVYYWNTPIGDLNKNMEITKELLKEPNVKVVLVDYEQPASLE